MRIVYYIDPGTGGLVASSLWHIIVVVLGIIAGFFLSFFRPIKKAMTKLWSKIKGSQ